MPRVKKSRYCIRCGEPFYRYNGNTGAKYCSRFCACLDRNTKEHQVKAGMEGGKHNIAKRGTGTKTYVKYYGRHEHRVVVEKFLGRKLKSDEIIHHIDQNKHNNSIKNLRLLTRAEHMGIHLHEKT